MTGRPTALGRSFDIYYRDQERAARMDRLNAEFVPNGGLAFDIGAHVGDRTGSFRRLGARVVAVEPQRRIFRALKLIYGRDPKVTLAQTAVGARQGALELYVNSDNPTISTGSRDLISAAQGAEQWQGQSWNVHERVAMTTLDALISAHGLPDFIKIDVEGFEHEVLQGLNHPIAALSFEFTTIQREVALLSLERLAQLAPYSFNLSLGEEHALRYETWLNAQEMGDALLALPGSANSGDVFARFAG